MSDDNWMLGVLGKAAKASLPSRLAYTLLGMAFFSVLIVSLVLGALWLDGLFGNHWPLAETLSILLSIPIIGVGLILMLWTAGQFFRAEGSPVPLNPPPKLVDRGLYAYTRNPMMSGLFIFLFGMGIFSRSVSLTFILTPGIIALATWYLKAVEEPDLERRLGQDYAQYKKRVAMYLPRFKRE